MGFWNRGEQSQRIVHHLISEEIDIGLEPEEVVEEEEVEITETTNGVLADEEEDTRENEVTEETTELQEPADSSEEVLTEEPEVEEDIDIWEVEEGVVDVQFEGVGDYYVVQDKAIKTVEDGILIDTDLGDATVGDNEDQYKAQELAEKVTPIIEQVTDRAVSETIRYQNEKTRLDVQEALHEEVAYRLGKYERRRKRRKFSNFLGVLIKAIIIIVVVSTIWSNVPLRNKIINTAQNLYEIVIGLINDEDVSSNEFFEELFEEEETESDTGESN